MDKPLHWTPPVILGLTVTILCLIATSLGSFFQYEQLQIARQPVAIPTSQSLSQAAKTPDGRGPVSEAPFIVSVVSAVLALLGFGALVYVARKKPGIDSPEHSDLEILSAHYGVESVKEVDVTESVKSYKRDALAIHVNNSTFGCDPVPNGFNTLRVEYRYRGLFRKGRKQEPGLLVLPEDEIANKEIELTKNQLKACREVLNHWRKVQKAL